MMLLKCITKFKTEEIFDLIYSCVDHIFEGEKIYLGKDTAEMRKSFLIV